jgi:hypothetical protein
MILANYFIRLSATVLDAKIYNKQRIQANSVGVCHRDCHSVAARLPLRRAVVHQWGSLEMRRFHASEVSFAVLSVYDALLAKAAIRKHANQNIVIKKIVLKFAFCF